MVFITRMLKWTSLSNFTLESGVQSLKVLRGAVFLFLLLGCMFFAFHGVADS